ncbi:MAG: metal ABC transporter permease, partial [Verrucomicrobiota bacterium]
MIPIFDWNSFWSDPWSAREFGTTLPIVLQGFLVSAACGWIGVLLIIRRLALVGDAISHSVLPGLVLAALIFDHLTGPAVIFGALLAGFATTAGIEWVQSSSRVKPDAAIGIVFASLFALGVVMLSQMKNNIHLDADCVLYGDIAVVAMPSEFIVHPQIIQSAVVLIVTLLLSWFFFKEILISSFDSILAKSVGIKAKWIH